MTIFNQVWDSTKHMGFIREMFPFIDANQLVSKSTILDSRNKAIKAGLGSSTMKSTPKLVVDSQARSGSKGSNRI